MVKRSLLGVCTGLIALFLIAGVGASAEKAGKEAGQKPVESKAQKPATGATPTAGAARVAQGVGAVRAVDRTGRAGVGSAKWVRAAEPWRPARRR